LKRKLSIFLFLLLTSFGAYAQDEYEISQEQWEKVRDKYADDAILLLAKMDTLNLNIDSLRSIVKYFENLDCEEELYKAVGSTKEEVAGFRKKFEYTESRIQKREGTPVDARNMYFDEITASKIRCLPEFSGRYYAMSIALNDFFAGSVEKHVTVTDTSAYLVEEGDNLMKVSEKKYGTPDYWKLIWKANKKSVANADEFYERFKKKIINPNIIYPGQKLFIPPKP
jgi:hypothetical protein